MKRSEVIFYSVLVLSIFVFAACQVGPGEAVKRPKQDAVASKPVEDAISSSRQLLACTNIGGACDFDSPPCCSGAICVNSTCQQQNQTNQTSCTPGYTCPHYTTSGYRLSNCSIINQTICNNTCNPATGLCFNCAASTFCQGSYSNTTYSNCTSTRINCQYGCNATTTGCNSAPPGCTPSTQCVNSTFIQNFSNCTSASTNCASQNKTCNATLGCI